MANTVDTCMISCGRSSWNVRLFFSVNAHRIILRTMALWRNLRSLEICFMVDSLQLSGSIYGIINNVDSSSWVFIGIKEGKMKTGQDLLTFNALSLTWWRHRIETFSALLALCAGNSLVTGEFPSQRPVTRSFNVFFDLRLNKRLSEQPRCRWSETPSRSFWRHCNVNMTYICARLLMGCLERKLFGI